MSPSFVEPAAAGFAPDPRLPPGARRYRVGGAVRDRLLGRAVTETDWLIAGTTPEAMRGAGFLPVGADFPVFLHPDSKEEYALARTERKSGRGYHGFTFHAGAAVTVEEDLSRRDLTINAIAEDADGRLVDPHGGAADLDARLLRHVGPAFAEDPVRILRLARFAARFAVLGFAVAPETLSLCRAMVADGEADHLVPERVWKEASRALLEPRPEVFFDTLRAAGALARLMPELDALWGVPQPPEHHPEIDTGVHTMLVLARAAALGGGLEARWAAVCHDLGKALTPRDEWPRHLGHEARGVAPTEALSARLKVPNTARALAVLVCRDHLHVHRVGELAPKTLHDLLERLDAFRPAAGSRFGSALLVCQADMQGRLGHAERPYPQAGFLERARAIALGVAAREVVADGFQGAAIGVELRRRRIGALRAWKKTQAGGVADPGAADPDSDTDDPTVATVAEQGVS